MSDTVSYMLIIGLIVVPAAAFIALGDRILLGLFELDSLILVGPFG